MKKITLLYGYDAALMRFREQQTLDRFYDRFPLLQVIPFEKEIPLEKTREPSLFDGSQQGVYVFRGCAVSFSDLETIQKILSDSTSTLFLMLTSSPPPHKTKLGSMLKTHPQAHLVKCYDLSFQEFQTDLGLELQRHNLTVEARGAEFLYDHYRKRMDLLRMDLKKLALWSAPSSHASLRDLQELFTQGAPQEVETWVTHILMGNRAQTLKSLLSLLNQELDPLILVRSCLYHLSILYRLRLQVDDGVDLTQAFEQKISPVLFTYRPLYQKKFHSWGRLRLSAWIEAFLGLEKNLKLYPTQARALLSHFLWTNV